MGDFDALLALIRRFRDERDWSRFHSCKNLAGSIAIESGELLECLQWVDGAEAEDLAMRNREELSAEVADVIIYCLLLLDRLGIDPVAAITSKIEQNAEKYPPDLSRGRSLKYDRLDGS